MWTILSGIFGGLLRLAPEIFKMINAKSERAHELAMQKVAYDFQVLKGQQEKDIIYEKGAAEYNTNAVDALATALREQGKPSGIKWIDGLNSLVRPIITFQWVVFLYPAVIVAGFMLAVKDGVAPLTALVQSFGDPEKALVSFIVDFWFVGRVLDAGRKKYGGT
jgi:hypothetical protein